MIGNGPVIVNPPVTLRVTAPFPPQAALASRRKGAFWLAEA